MNALRILLTDDHPIFRMGLKDILKDLPVVQKIQEAGDGLEALTLLENNEFDIVFMDIQMPKLNGIQTTSKILATYPSTKVIALTMSIDQKEILAMYDAGVSGYILKNTSLEELKRALEKVSNDEQYYCNEVSEVLFRALLKKDKSEIIPGHEADSITPREKEILKMLCEQLSTEEIADKLSLSVLTIKRHRQNLLQKTNAKNLAGLVVFAIKNNLFNL